MPSKENVIPLSDGAGEVIEVGSGVDRVKVGDQVSLPFNIAHAAGNFVFCLAFGPAFVRTLARFRARLSVHWRPVLDAAPDNARVT